MHFVEQNQLLKREKDTFAWSIYLTQILTWLAVKLNEYYPLQRIHGLLQVNFLLKCFSGLIIFSIASVHS